MSTGSSTQPTTPIDAAGAPLQQGDTVHVPAKIKSVQGVGPGATLQLQAHHHGHPGSDNLTLKAGQVLKSPPPEVAGGTGTGTGSAPTEAGDPASTTGT